MTRNSSKLTFQTPGTRIHKLRLGTHTALGLYRLSSTSSQDIFTLALHVQPPNGRNDHDTETEPN